jgi:hypothetical protein
MTSSHLLIGAVLVIVVIIVVILLTRKNPPNTRRLTTNNDCEKSCLDEEANCHRSHTAYECFKEMTSCMSECRPPYDYD